MNAVHSQGLSFPSGMCIVPPTLDVVIAARASAQVVTAARMKWDFRMSPLSRYLLLTARPLPRPLRFP